MRFTRLIVIVFLVITLVGITIPARGQTAERPFIMPVAGEASAGTWLFGQAYGNTTGAFNFGTAWYSAGQGLHFGIDLPMPCGTPLVAVADGTVAFVDNLSFGAGPHNLLIIHEAYSLVSLYGHLRGPADVFQGQRVTQGQIVGYSGDPDSTCDSRPHLHYEVRALNYRTAYNPIAYIDANWHMLASIGGYSYPLFQGDMNNARRWMSLDDQPDTAFGGVRLNDYPLAWPLPNELRAPASPRLATASEPLDANAAWTARQLGFESCCWQHWWDGVDPDRLYTIDGAENQRASVFAWSASAGSITEMISEAPPAVTSADGSHQVFNNGGAIVIRRIADGTEFTPQTQGVTPGISPDNDQIVWTVRSGVSIPGQPDPTGTVYVSALDGDNAQAVIAAPGASAVWLDADRLLVNLPGDGRLLTLDVYDTRDGSRFTLGTWRNTRGVSIAPGGGRLMFMLTWQDDPAASGIWTIETIPGAQPVSMPWFGGWRWRDADSVYYLPFDPGSASHTLAYYHIPTGEDRQLTTPDQLPFTIMNGDWHVSADGQRIAFMNAVDRNLWLLETTPATGGSELTP